MDRRKKAALACPRFRNETEIDDDADRCQRSAYFNTVNNGFFGLLDVVASVYGRGRSQSIIDKRGREAEGRTEVVAPGGRPSPPLPCVVCAVQILAFGRAPATALTHNPPPYPSTTQHTTQHKHVNHPVQIPLLNKLHPPPPPRHLRPPPRYQTSHYPRQKTRFRILRPLLPRIRPSNLQRCHR